jgi:DNA modification methylase
MTFKRIKNTSVYIGNAIEELQKIPSESIHCVVTSPPYYGLRSYLNKENPLKEKEIGLEKSPEKYVENLVCLFREIKRVLRRDGVVFLNLGDSYAAKRGGSHPPAETLAGGVNGRAINGDIVNRNRNPDYNPSRDATAIGYKHKDLMGIPWRVAFALQADGWYLRQDIIWGKKHCLPESIQDRCVKSHEYLFLLSKKPKYFFDHIAIREETANSTKQRLSQNVNLQLGYSRIPGKTNGNIKAAGNLEFRNKRSVWWIAPAPYKGAHFATMPPKLIEPCILAGTSEKGCCVECGSPYVRKEKVVGKQVTEQMLACGSDKEGNYIGQATKEYTAGKAQNPSDTKRRILESLSKVREYFFEKTCNCETDGIKPCVVLDPFGGSGTTAWVAESLKRSAIVIELNVEYLPLIEERLNQPYVVNKIKKAKKVKPEPRQLTLFNLFEDETE